MPTHIFVNNEGLKNDSVSIFYSDNTFVVISDRDDLNIVQNLEESRKPGIYILMSDDQRYVGQSSDAILNRLRKHDVNKPWWSRVMFFGREDGRLTKAQLDYLELRLINIFAESHYKSDNLTNGNTSYIDKLSEINAKSLLSSVEMLLKVAGNIDLFDSAVVRTKYEDVSKTISPKTVTFDNHTFDFRNGRSLWVEIVSYAINTYGIERLAKYVSPDGLPTSTTYLGTKENISSKNNKLTSVLPDLEYFAYSNYSRSAFKSRIEDLARHLATTCDVGDVLG